ncbi:MAG TPA: hypothetical protein VM692_11725, partial [Gammaproteobacteria bacterium]|nr:hypothetical protein [Gammaproteobacteria bacterium]
MRELNSLVTKVTPAESRVTEVLALAQPIAFGRVYRLRTVANAIGAQLKQCDASEPLPLLEKVGAGTQLTEAERTQDVVAAQGV